MRRAVLQAAGGVARAVPDLEPRERRGGRPRRRDRGDARLRPAAARAALFGAAAANDAPRAAILAATAAQLGVAPDALEAALFADLPGERPVRAPDPVPTPAEIALHTNLALAQTVVMRAAHVALRVEGGLRSIVRLAKFRGLICSVAAARGGRAAAPRHLGAVLAVPPHAGLRARARRAAAAPRLVRALRARAPSRACAGGSRSVSMESGDPIFPARAPAPFDSRLEERFAADVAPPGAGLGRHPRACAAASGRDAHLPRLPRCATASTRERQALVEIVGFWTPDYLTEKLARLRQAATVGVRPVRRRGARLRGVELPPGLPVVTFRRRVDAAAVMREVERLTAGASPPDTALRSSG